MSVNVCPDDSFWITEHFVAKLAMVMQHREPECHAERKSLLSSRSRSQRGLVWSKYYSFCYTFSPRGLTFTWWGCCGLCQRHKPKPKSCLPTPFVLCLFLSYGLFNCISFNTFSRQLSPFSLSLCSFGLNSALLVLSTIYLYLEVFLSPDIILYGWLDLSTNWPDYLNCWFLGNQT